MHLLLNLNAETEARLREQADLTGKSPEALALEALQEKLSGEMPFETLSTEEWLSQFDAWVSEQRSRNPQFDDSRESIYPDRL